MTERPLVTCLWFDTQAEEAATFYTGIFKNSKITSVSRYTEAGKEIHGRTPGSVMAMTFQIEGQTFTAINGGPMFKFTEAISLVVMCQDQKEIDHYWSKFGEGGDPEAQVCGWLKDKFGLSWQIVPKNISEIANHPKAMEAVMQMKKLDLAVLDKALAS